MAKKLSEELEEIEDEMQNMTNKEELEEKLNINNAEFLPLQIAGPLFYELNSKPFKSPLLNSYT